MKKCSIEGCNGRYICKGYCTKHYQRWLNHGNPLALMAKEAFRGLSAEERFHKKYKIDEVTQCWNWQDRLNIWGYGYLSVKINNKWHQYFAHRYSYELYKDKIPKDLLVCHLCDNPACVNPDHLWIGTNKDNSNDRDRKGRLNHKDQERKGYYRKCKSCENQIYVTPYFEKTRNYCSYKCMGKDYKDQVKNICKECKIEFQVIKSRKKSASYCGKKCRMKNLPKDRWAKRNK